MTTLPSHPFETDAALRRRLTALARRWLGPGLDAEDMVQEAYLRTASGGLPDGEAGRQAWLTTVVHHLCIDSTRRQARYAVVLAQVSAGLTQEVASPERLTEQRQNLLQALSHLVERLAPEDVAAVLLYEVFEFGHAELGAISGRSEAASRQHMHRVLRRLKYEASETHQKSKDRLDAENAALLTQCWLAMVQRDAGGLIALLQASPPMALACAAGNPAHAGTTAAELQTSTQLMLVQGQLVLAVCLGESLLCLLPMDCNWPHAVGEHV